MALNKARMEHLASFDLGLGGMTVLDAGSGVGDVADALASLGSTVTTIVGRDDNVAVTRARYPHLRGFVRDVEDRTDDLSGDL